MKFTDTQFVQAVELIQTIESSKSRKDKRRAARTAIRVPVGIKLGVDAASEWQVVRLRDISPRGARLEMPKEMESGGTFLLRLPTKDGKKMGRPLICRVAHCARQRDYFLIGAEFIGQYSAPASAGDKAADRSRIQQSILE